MIKLKYIYIFYIPNHWTITDHEPVKIYSTDNLALNYGTYMEEESRTEM